MSEETDSATTSGISYNDQYPERGLFRAPEQLADINPGFSDSTRSWAIL